MAKDRINPEIKTQFAKLKLSSLTFQSGGLYKTRDAKVLFPTRKLLKDADKPRYVVVMGAIDQLNDPLLPHVLAIPVTTRFEYETTQDYRVDAGIGNLTQDSLIKAGMIQPILKSDFEKQIGVLEKQEYEELTATVLLNLGILDDSEDEDETKVRNSPQKDEEQTDDGQ